MKTLLVTVFFSFILPLVCFSTTIKVPEDQPTIQNGIDAALNGDVVLVAPGTYMENLFFHGKAVTVKSSGGPAETLIDGGSDGSVVSFVDGETSDSVLEGFTLTNGNGTWLPHFPAARYGGGILCTASSPKILDNIIENNSCYIGGGISCHSAFPIIDGNIIRSNHDCGIEIREDSSPSISNNLIVENTSVASGAGIACVMSSAVQISNNTICDNTGVWDGGGVAFETCSNITMTGNVISGNHSLNHGGGVHFANIDSIACKGNIISKNVADRASGGIDVSSCQSVGIAGNIVTDNFVGVFYGGGIGIFASEVYLVNNSIAGNRARDAGGGVYCRFDCTVTVINSIIWGNSATEGTELWIGFEDKPSIVTLRNCDVGGGEALVYVERPSQSNWGAGMIDADPCFVDPASDDYHLAFDSPCLGAGYNDAAGLPAFDYEGDPRNWYNVDIGADEFHTHLYGIGDGVPAGSIDLKIVGFPGNSPVGLFLGSGVIDPPVQHKWGLFYLAEPWILLPLNPIPSNGVMVIPAIIPSSPAGYDVPMQALVGSKLSNLYVLEVN